MVHLPRTTPIIVGVGEVKNKSLHLNDAIEPAELMASAIRKSFKDTGANENHVRAAIDGLLIVPPWTWPYVDLPGVISKKVGFLPSHSQMGVHGGHQPNEWCDEAARRVATGESKAVIITGVKLLHHVCQLIKLLRVLFLLTYLDNYIQWQHVRRLARSLRQGGLNQIPRRKLYA